MHENDMSVNERMGGFIFLLIERVRIWRKMAAKREQYGHNGGKFFKDTNDRKRKSKFIKVCNLANFLDKETQ